MLRKFTTPYMADWFAISLRWIILVGLIVSLGLGRKLELFISWPLGLLIVWNLAMTAMAGLNVRIAYHRQISILVYLVLSVAFYWVQGGLRGPAVWAGLLPILTGSIYFEFLGAFVTSLLFAAFMMALGVLVEGETILPGIISGTLVLLSFLFGFLGRRMMMHMRKNRELWQDAEECHAGRAKARHFRIDNHLVFHPELQTRARIRAQYERHRSQPGPRAIDIRSFGGGGDVVQCRQT